MKSVFKKYKDIEFEFRKINGSIYMKATNINKLEVRKSLNSWINSKDTKDLKAFLSDNDWKIGSKYIFTEIFDGKKGTWVHECLFSSLSRIVGNEFSNWLHKKLKEIIPELDKIKDKNPKETVEKTYLELSRKRMEFIENLHSTEKEIEFFKQEINNRETRKNLLKNKIYKKDKEIKEIIHRDRESSPIYSVKIKHNLYFNPSDLIKTSKELGLGIKKVNNGVGSFVNSYHRDVWLKLYNIDIGELNYD